MIELFTQEEAAKYLGVDVATLCRWRKQGTLAACKRGRWVRYLAAELERFVVESQEAKPDGRRAKINKKKAEGQPQ